MHAHRRLHVVIAAAALAALGTACNFNFGFDGTRYRCGDGDRCPPGQTCIAGFCEADPDGGGDGDGGPDADLSGPCGNLTLLQDTFDVAGPGAYFYQFADTGSTITEAGGQLVMDVNANVSAYAGYIGRYLYDLHGGGFEGSVSAVLSGNTILEVRNHLGNVIQVVHQDGNIAAATYNAPNAMTYAERPWNPAERYWRIRADEDELIWEVSTDRATWNELHRTAPPFDISHVRGAIAGGGQAPTASQARFDDVNPDAPNALFCSASDFVDDFAAAPFEPQWDSYSETGCTITETGGNLAFSYSATTGNIFCGVNSFHLWDLSRGDGVVIDSNGLPTVPNFISYFQASVIGSSDVMVETSLDNTSLEYRLYVNDAITDRRTLTLDRTMHRYWRMRAEGVIAIFETSPDRGQWTERWRINAPVTLSPVEVSIGAGLYGAVTLPLSATVPGLNSD
jgi:hypothetical protein